MAPPSSERPRLRLQIGDLRVSRDSVILETLLGSCVSVCVFDAVAGVGGMNHIFLPGAPRETRCEGSTRFGIHAMDRLLHGLWAQGGVRPRLRARIFGGAHLLRAVRPEASAGVKNVEFADRYLAGEGIPVLERNVGGTETRILAFHPRTGEAHVRRLPRARAGQLLAAEACYQQRLQAGLAGAGGTPPVP